MKKIYLWGKVKDSNVPTHHGEDYPKPLDDFGDNGSHQYVTLSVKEGTLPIMITLGVSNEIVIYISDDPDSNWSKMSARKLLSISYGKGDSIPSITHHDPITSAAIPEENLTNAAKSWPKATIRAAQRILGLRGYDTVEEDEEQDVDPAVVGNVVPHE